MSISTNTTLARCWRLLSIVPMILSLSGGYAHGGQTALVRVTTAIVQDYATSATLTGEVVARHSLNLSFRIDGQIAEILVDKGQHVEAGTVLSRLDPQLQRADLSAAQAAVEAAKAQLLLAQSDFDRNSELYDRGFTTRAVFDQSDVALVLATGAYEVSASQLELAQIMLSYTEILAPTVGTITQTFTEEGQIAPFASPVFTFASNGARDAVFDVHEAILITQNEGATITLASVASPDVEAECVLREISPTVNPFTGTVHVKCGIVNPPSEMSLASVVRGTAELSPRPLIVLPWGAMASDNGKTAVWVYAPATGTVSIRGIEVDSYEAGNILVRGGLADGEIIVTEGTQFLHEGMSVKPITEGGQ